MKHNYNIVEITEYVQLLRYKDYTEWCIIITEIAYEYYLDFGKRRLYILERDDYTSLSSQKGQGYPYDSYGLSLIAVITNADGTLANVTTRWNSIEEDEEGMDIGRMKELVGNCTFTNNSNNLNKNL